MVGLMGSLEEIFNYRRLDDRLATGGQPRPEQFPSLKQAGFDGVINLALPTSDNALADEGSRVTALGLFYVHIPVVFDAPTAADFNRFLAVIQALRTASLFIHCAANMRVSAFVYLYRRIELGMAASIAEADLQSIWSPDPIWANFIAERLREHGIHEKA